MSNPDGDRVKRVAEAMLKMVKLDIAGLEAARGDSSLPVELRPDERNDTK